MKRISSQPYFKQYMANQPDKFWFKFWMASDAKYTWHAIPYLQYYDALLMTMLSRNCLKLFRLKCYDWSFLHQSHCRITFWLTTLNFKPHLNLGDMVPWNTGRTPPHHIQIGENLIDFQVSGGTALNHVVTCLLLNENSDPLWWNNQ